MTDLSGSPSHEERISSVGSYVSKEHNVCCFEADAWRYSLVPSSNELEKRFEGQRVGSSASEFAVATIPASPPKMEDILEAITADSSGCRR